MYQISLHIFRRDLRLQDNSALIQALSSSKTVLPCFIFDKRQIENNDYKSDHCIQFMLNSLSDLQNQLQKKNGKLFFYYGIAEDIIDKLITEHKVEAVFINRDYTPFSRERDHQIELICKKHQIDFHNFADILLHEPEEVHKTNGDPYTIFTPYFHKASALPVGKIKKNLHDNYFQQNSSLENKNIFEKLSQKNNANILVKGGREEALHLLEKISTLNNYEEQKNYPAQNGTTKLSAHNKFGTISIREFFSVSPQSLIKELYWRDFFTHIGFHFPHVFEGAFLQQYNKLRWSKSENHFRAWCEGRTGFPIVDAGMRELNQTGYMHNRVRMITASFLVKDLHIDWRWGEKYFAQQLVDYDPAVNNGNWQWAASTGCDAQPYFRIFNPWLQQKKFDPECLYIKRFIPELAKLPAAIIHDLANTKHEIFSNYPTPMLSHTVESKKTTILYKSCK